MIRAVTLDLDDTLWPFAPVARRIRDALDAFLAEHAPRTAARYEQAAVDEALAAVRAQRDVAAHDIGALRRAVLGHLLEAAGEDPELADPAFEAIYAARQRVELYPDAAAGLDRLAARVPLLAITNGNADLELTGVARWFTGCVAAHDVGVAKPHPAVFESACERLGLRPEEILHAGDDLETDVGGALVAGLQSVWVRRELSGVAPAGAHTVADLTALAELVERDG
ncbi:MAG: HAD family hydrolase [Solirubrobacterales bacterium]|nr:HAD family hydrolase [Solirubrobacterales bacterium]